MSRLGGTLLRRVILLVAGQDIRVLSDRGELLRKLELDPTSD